jgi:hypothetical protein
MELTVSELVEEAAARNGCPPPGPVPFAENLARLLRSCQASARLNDVGRDVLHKAALRHLRNVLAVEAYVAAHPKVGGRPLDGALVVTGLPRTGTTLLHNLLAVDPDHRALRVWEALRPVPPGPDGPPAAALQERAERWLEAFYRVVPEFRAIHPATATGPEECDALLQNTFASQHFDDMFDAPEYSAWLAHASLRAEYGFYARQLRVLSTPGAGTGTRWALKSPSHLGHLDDLLAALPGCTVIVCHRAPRLAVASYASLVHALRGAYSDDPSPAAIGRQALHRAATAMGRALAARHRAGEARFVDVAYRDLARDPVGAARAVYAHLGRPLGPGVEDAMRRWVAAHPAGQHGPHRYDLERFGLAEDDVDAAFAAYAERFGALAAG